MTTSTARLPSALDRGRELVQPALREAVEHYLGSDMALVARYHHGWTDAEGTPTDVWTGKLVRPALTLLSAQAAGNSSADGTPAAAAVELVHNFSLLHDDIMDGDTARRGRATAWTLFGAPSATLAGNALLTTATSLLLDAEAVGARSAAASLMSATQRMINGQATDIAFEHRDDVTPAECLRMAGDKTGALLACACSLGAELAGAEAALIGRLHAFGEHLGIAFQLVDDLLGIWGESGRTGKETGADLRVRKRTLPVVAALDAQGSDELATLYFRREPLDEREVRRVAELVEGAGGRDWALSRADHHVAAARECLAEADLAESVRAEFLEFAEFMTGRRF
ncbi:geranylgeranyl diphosphate synthase type I [Saccharopolyspora lacisalsi]|uniref:Geranylgeranyl diphosphate synthase type I n=1 Tax=Halosaccharopolyspora lacisalsi TaxID=1000566 RepID=A0A839DYW8_9PSEU|nr:polyprenyl synthetase family protein [Halosaccharopolyspora lacisalsi]MBA8826203.1 geranylgeranyl diphosphate synthase type I [Halosaccharopolyspora lacisalsi]